MHKPAGIYPKTDELIKLRFAARGISLAPQSPASAATSGAYRSRFRGRGVDYSESRRYQHGDDIRNMDWRVTARTGKAHTKLFQEERERPVIILLDCGSSMFFGTQQSLKSILAARLAATVGWAAVQRGDRIGAFGFSTDRHQELRPVGGRRGALTLIRHMTDWFEPPENANALPVHNPVMSGEAFTHALKRLRYVVRPGSLIVMISDFYNINHETRRHLSRLRSHNDLVACQVYDPVEMQPPPAGVYPISNGENTGMLNTRGQHAQQRYQDYINDHFDQLQQLTRQLGIPLQPASTTDDPVRVIKRLFVS